MSADLPRLMPSTMISKKDYGIKIAKRGYDVSYASDTELLYNSSFPVLAIANYISEDTPREVIREGEISEWNEWNGSYTNMWVYEVRILHGLEYVPLVLRVNEGLLLAGGGSVEWDNRYIYIKYSWFTVGGYSTFVSGGRKLEEKLMVMAVNIEKDIEYPYFDYAIDSTAWGSESDYGFKYLLAGDIDNLNMNELGINPNVQSLMVTAVKVTKDPNETDYIPNGIDFRNLSAFCSVMVNDRWRFGGISAQAVAGYRPINNQDGTGSYEIDGLLFADMVSLVVARMPFISPDKTTFSFVM